MSVDILSHAWGYHGIGCGRRLLKTGTKWTWRTVLLGAGRGRLR